jgi:hypothetical protein
VTYRIADRYKLQQKTKFMNSADQRAFLQATAWLRPFTRWAAAFSLKTEGVLPTPIRNIPLKLVKLILTRNHKKTGSGDKPR